MALSIGKEMVASDEKLIGPSIERELDTESSPVSSFKGD